MPHYNGNFFENFLLRATERADLNDPFEFLPPKDFYDAVVEYALKGTDIEWAKNITYDEFRRSFYLSNGVISFTETRSNLLMWSHYAQGHTGLVIEFYIQNYFFKTVKRVGYDNIRPYQINVTDLDNLFFIKSDEWIYEKEYRIVKRKSDHDYYMNKSDMILHPAKMSAIHSEEGAVEMYMFSVPKECIKSVTFGINIDNNIKNIIIDKIKSDKELVDVDLWESQLSKEYYNLEFFKIKNI